MSASWADIVACCTLTVSLGGVAMSTWNNVQLERGALRVNGWVCWVSAVSSTAGVFQHAAAGNRGTATILAIMAGVQWLGAGVNYARRANHWWDVRKGRRPWW